MSQQADARSNALPEPVHPGSDVVPAMVQHLVGRTVAPTSSIGQGTADAIMATSVDTQHRAADFNETLGKAVKQAGTIEVAASAMHQAKAIHR
jgi:hypothetical protein